MKIEELQAHCVEQMRKLPRGSKMYEEHLLTLSIIDTNKKYFNEIDKLSKIINYMLDDLDTKGFEKQEIYNSYKHRVEHSERYFQ